MEIIPCFSLFPSTLELIQEPESQKGLGGVSGAHPVLQWGCPGPCPGGFSMSPRWKILQLFVFLVPWLFFHFFSSALKSSQLFPSAQGDPIPCLGGRTVTPGFREVKLPETPDVLLAPSHSRNPTNPHSNLVVNIPKHHTVPCSCFVQQMSPPAREKHNLFL